MLLKRLPLQHDNGEVKPTQDSMGPLPSIGHFFLFFLVLPFFWRLRSGSTNYLGFIWQLSLLVVSLWSWRWNPWAWVSKQDPISHGWRLQGEDPDRRRPDMNTNQT